MIFFSLFHLTVVLIVINALITIICDAFTTVRFDKRTALLNKENEEVKKCFCDMILKFLHLYEDPDEIGGKKSKVRQVIVYKTPADMFPNSITRLTKFVDNVSFLIDLL